MKILIVPSVPRKPLTLVWFLKTGQSSIFCIQVSSGNLLLMVHLWPTTTAVSTHRKDLCPENVPPACLIFWITQLTFCRCSHTNLWIPGFSGIVSKTPSWFWYWEVGPFTGMSSKNRMVTCSISSCSKIVISPWKFALSLCNPWVSMLIWGYWVVFGLDFFGHIWQTDWTFHSMLEPQMIQHMVLPLESLHYLWSLLHSEAVGHVQGSLSAFRSFFNTQNHQDW